MCTDLLNVHLWKHTWFKTLMYTFIGKSRFEFPVVYTDGLISVFVKDASGRIPFGILMKDVIICMEDAPYLMNYAAASEYCKNIHFAGHCATIATYELMKEINLFRSELNQQFKKLRGEVVHNTYYWTKDLDEKGCSYMVVKMGLFSWVRYITASVDAELDLRPVIDLKDVSTRL